MLRSTIYFITEIPDLGNRVNVAEPVSEIRHKLQVAKRNDDHTITCHHSGGNTVEYRKLICIPVHLIGPFEEKR